MALAWRGLGKPGLLYVTRICGSFSIRICQTTSKRNIEAPTNLMSVSWLLPSSVQEVEKLDWVICTHQHSDHMDPEALPILASESPACRFIIPKASQEHLLNLGVPNEQIAGIDAPEKILLSSACSVEVIPSAHEALEKERTRRIPLLGLHY